MEEILHYIIFAFFMLVLYRLIWGTYIKTKEYILYNNIVLALGYIVIFLAFVFGHNLHWIDLTIDNNLNIIISLLTNMATIQATIGALLITLTLVAVQLTAQRYSESFNDIFLKNRGLWFLIGFYTISIVLDLILIFHLQLDVLSKSLIFTAFGFFLINLFYVPCYIKNTLVNLKPENVLDETLNISYDELVYYILDAMDKESIQSIMENLKENKNKDKLKIYENHLKKIQESNGGYFKVKNPYKNIKSYIYRSMEYYEDENASYAIIDYLLYVLNPYGNSNEKYDLNVQECAKNLELFAIEILQILEYSIYNNRLSILQTCIASLNKVNTELIKLELNFSYLNNIFTNQISYFTTLIENKSLNLNLQVKHHILSYYKEILMGFLTKILDKDVPDTQYNTNVEKAYTAYIDTFYKILVIIPNIYEYDIKEYGVNKRVFEEIYYELLNVIFENAKLKTSNKLVTDILDVIIEDSMEVLRYNTKTELKYIKNLYRHSLLLNCYLFKNLKNTKYCNRIMANILELDMHLNAEITPLGFEQYVNITIEYFDIYQKELTKDDIKEINDQLNKVVLNTMLKRVLNTNKLI
ncbi:hypothetical protein J3E07_001566 [Methanococcus voltae]|uniref:DUF2254 domain-containing protein n=1 Tax=Methanococcus voltae TaxID=2188 RepID=A0A8J7S5Y2_METVO|nr:DUF2254 family protein [Methanococcus voltae]MBP2202125.1 hypothetical protein [Methanococcus voltae]